MAFNIEVLDENKNIDLITIYDDQSEIKFTNFGMRIVDWKVNGQSVILGPTKQDDIIKYYEENPYFFGATVGRYGGRIDGAIFDLNGESYQLEQNDGKHNLHGGSHGLHTHICDYDIVNEETAVSVIYSVELKSSIDHFPGDMDIKITHRYDLIEKEWHIEYEATSTEDTLFNPMNHVYFNLNKEKNTIDNHTIQNDIKMYRLNDDQIVESKETDDINEILTKESLTFKDIFESDLPQINQYNGLDHPIDLKKQPFKVSYETLEVEMNTDHDYVVLFTLNDVDWNDQEQSIVEHAGFTLEAQSIPDDIHLLEDQAPSILKKGQTYQSKTSYKLNIL
ncbi:hypothetical protein [Mammaliicoccus sp. Dog046]|uniref:aldose epimerase family protein n=1 Tax=Mammaliicoccus sp. Dog046 TaxID=3034233 RepID=UPI002B25D876|nr:hypothetical protein [Mammaliicoccus sp. Dog046]WQK85210.1 hypothetical protein P3U32_11345 [Mammaliicoccus sp. Dog046]